MKYIFALLILLIPNVSGAEMTKTQEEVAIFAGGCFWCMEKPFDKIEGVISTTSGYTGGSVLNPTYEQVSAGGTGHVEALQVIYDPSKVDYETLLKVFWRNIDPLDNHGQFCDKGTQYRSAIFYKGDKQKELAKTSLKFIEKELNHKVATDIIEASKFYPAEDYHQNYYSRNPVRYNFYRYRCGRDERLNELWGSDDH